MITKKCRFLLTLLLFLPLSLNSLASDVSSGMPRDKKSCDLQNWSITVDSCCVNWVDSVISTLSLEEKVGQLFIHTMPLEVSEYNFKMLTKAVQRYKIGGLLFSGGTIQAQAQLTNKAQHLAKIPLMVTFDGEWGLAMRLKNAPKFPKNQVLGCISDNKLIYQYGLEMARQCKMAGVQVNFAPVADVNINPNNPVIGDRAFGDDVHNVANKVVAYAKGLEDGGVLSVSKHFPGHGDTNVDSHKALPTLNFSKERLDSIELAPFKAVINAGLNGIMVGHLQVPAFEPKKGLPASLSKRIVDGLLKKKLNYNGLVFTDALAMQGVAHHNELSLKALMAGNDMVLAPRDLNKEIGAVMKALQKGTISEEFINEKCRKVLTYKYKLGLDKKPIVKSEYLEKRLNNQKVTQLIRELNLAAITLLKNEPQILPFSVQEKKTVALLKVGNDEDMTPFVDELERYTEVKTFYIHSKMSNAQQQNIRKALRDYEKVVVALNTKRLVYYNRILNRILPAKPSLFVAFVEGKRLLELKAQLNKANAIILAHSANSDVQIQVAKIIYGEALVNGKLSTTLKGLFKANTGYTLTPDSLPKYVTDKYGFFQKKITKVDSIAWEGIKKGAYPGCQIVIMKNDSIVFDKAYGTKDGDINHVVKRGDVYDIASLSKVSATLLAVMKLYDRGLLNLTDRASKYLPFLAHSDKRYITIQQLLMHESGLTPCILFYMEAINEKSYRHGLFSRRRSKQFSARLGKYTWGNPFFTFKKKYVASQLTPKHTLQITDSLWLSDDFLEVYKEKIVSSKLRSKRYRYSDVGFILLKMVVEEITHQPLNLFLEENFYLPMGLTHTCYLPLKKIDKENIVPSCKETFLRKTTLRGYVHDEAAAFQGGVSGNAGLFSNAEEVARIFQMILNGGVYKGKRYLSEKTCELFTSKQSSRSERGVGFDRPVVKARRHNACADGVPATVFGHTGFTGTCAWADPENNMVFVFLSNRIYPSVANTQLMTLKIRERIQAAIYEAISYEPD